MRQTAISTQMPAGASDGLAATRTAARIEPAHGRAAEPAPWPFTVAVIALGVALAVYWIGLIRFVATGGLP